MSIGVACVCGGGVVSPLAGSRMQSTQHVGADKFPRNKTGGRGLVQVDYLAGPIGGSTQSGQGVIELGKSFFLKAYDFFYH